MTNRSYSVGTVWGPHWDAMEQTGVNTPAHLRSQGKFTNNPFYKHRFYGQSPRIGPIFYNVENGKERFITIPKANQDFKSWYVVQASFGTDPGLTRALAKLSDEWRNAPINLGMYLSPEGRESVQMVGSSLERFSKGVLALKRGSFGGFLEGIRPLPRPSRRRSYEKFTQGDLSGSFLAAHLGWEPLIKDTFTVLGGMPPPTIKSSKIRVRQPFPGNYIKLTPTSAAKLKQATCFKARKITANVIREAEWRERWGLSNPFEIAWELVPLSFVADYFLPIGDTIKASAFVAANVVNNCTQGLYSEYSYTVEAPPGSLKVISGGRVYSNREHYTSHIFESYASRSPYTPKLADSLDWKLSLPTSLTRLATITSLLHQRILSLR